MLKFNEYVLLQEQPAPPGGGLGGGPMGGIAGGIGGSPMPTGGHGAGPGGPPDPLGGLGGPPGPGGAAAQVAPKEIKSKDIWSLLEKVLSNGQQNADTSIKGSGGSQPLIPQQKEFKAFRT